MRLFCFPYAGKGALIYKNWAAHLPAEVEVHPVELPGRGLRFKEQPYTKIGSLIDDLTRAIRPLLDLPFAFFGHSLGAIVSFELAVMLRAEFHLEPAHLFVSGRRAPQIQDEKPVTYDLPDDEFISALERLNGTPREVLQHPELMQLMMGTLRADFEIAETYQTSVESPLNCPITAFGGLEDEDVPGEHVEAWKEQTTSSFQVRMLPGDHFFPHSSESVLLRIISRELDRLVNIS
jgi:medium-chain acyl-[acyl-carrier-protein] hydrolase